MRLSQNLSRIPLEISWILDGLPEGYSCLRCLL
jgi:hypothetical protein